MWRTEWDREPQACTRSKRPDPLYTAYDLTWLPAHRSDSTKDPREAVAASPVFMELSPGDQPLPYRLPGRGVRCG